MWETWLCLRYTHEGSITLKKGIRTLKSGTNSSRFKTFQISNKNLVTLESYKCQVKPPSSTKLQKTNKTRRNPTKQELFMKLILANDSWVSSLTWGTLGVTTNFASNSCFCRVFFAQHTYPTKAGITHKISALKNFTSNSCFCRVSLFSICTLQKQALLAKLVNFVSNSSFCRVSLLSMHTLQK